MATTAPLAVVGGKITATQLLARQKWIDGNTTLPAGQQNGGPTQPYVGPQPWLLTFADPVSVDDATTAQIGLLAPTAADVWSPAAQVWTIPRSRNIEIRSGDDTGNATFAPSVTATWANTAAAHVPAVAGLTLKNLNIPAGFALIVTDGLGSAPSVLLLEGEQGREHGVSGQYVGTLNVAGASAFGALIALNCEASLIVTNPIGGPTFGLSLDTTSWQSTNLTCTGVSAYNSHVQDTGSLTTTTGQQVYGNCVIGCAGLTSTTTIVFNQCTFSGGFPVITATNGVTFDGPSWESFILAGGTVAAATAVTVQAADIAATLPLVNHAAGTVKVYQNSAVMCQSSTGTTAVQLQLGVRGSV